MTMIRKTSILLLLAILIFPGSSCVTEFIPSVDEEMELLVVQGVLTDQGEPVTIKISTSLPLGQAGSSRPLSGCNVTITDDMGNTMFLYETAPGTYISSLYGIPGRTYKLNIKASESRNHFSYESLPMKMKPCPPIDSLYYEKMVIVERVDEIEGIEECQIYLDTRDRENDCRYYRWNYSETWMLRLLFDVPNQTCWISNNSSNIYIENTASLSEDLIKRHPVTYITKETDRLRTRYSILVNQYSLNEDEYNYWQKLQKMTEQVGGLYDVIPASIPGNITCIENPGEKVLGYFSVSGISSKRIYIQDTFEGIVDDYDDCITDTIYGEGDVEGLGISRWTLFDTPKVPFGAPRTRIFTETRGCADCTVRGTTEKPPFWEDEK